MDAHGLVADYLKVAELARLDVPPSAIAVEHAPAPHVAGPLPAGKMAAYVFLLEDKCLKVGRAGPLSGARYRSQHYLPASAGSNLAKSLLQAGAEFRVAELSEAEIGAWMRANLDRYNFLLDRTCGIAALTLLEVSSSAAYLRASKVSRVSANSIRPLRTEYPADATWTACPRFVELPDQADYISSGPLREVGLAIFETAQRVCVRIR